jgi:hypothetical protein
MRLMHSWYLNAMAAVSLQTKRCTHNLAAEHILAQPAAAPAGSLVIALLVASDAAIPTHQTQSVTCRRRHRVGTCQTA